jgi:methionine-rich copper-binding protein CopC
MLLSAGVERLLLLVFWAARGMFILQGIAFGLASVTVFAVASAEMPSWLRATFASSVTISVTFFLAGFLLIVERRWRVTRSGASSQQTWPWPLLLGLSLLVLPAVAVIAASDLPLLWSNIGTQLEAIGFWEGMTTPGPSGMVMLPLFLALFAPVLVTATALYSVAFPLAMLPLLVTRSRLFPTLLAMGATCQAALVFNSWIASGALVRVVSALAAAMADSGDAEVFGVSGELEREAAILFRTTLALAAPTLGLLAWFAILRPSGAAALYFASDRGAASAEQADVTLAEPVTPRPWTPVVAVTARQQVARQDVASQRSGPGALAQLARLGLAALGALMLLFGAADRLRTRAFYVESQPAPGATLTAGPTAVRATFGAELDPASSLSVTRLVSEPSAGNGPQDIDVASRLAPQDPQRRTLEVVSSALPVGLYRVSWRALPAGGGVSRHGSYSFGVGISVPADVTGMAHSLQEGDAGSRGRRQTMLGGVLLLLLGALLPWLSPRWHA